METNQFVWLLTTNEQIAVNGSPRCKVFSTRDKAKDWTDQVLLPIFVENGGDYPSPEDGRWEADQYTPTDLVWRGKRPKSGDTFFIFINRTQIDSIAFYKEGFISETDTPYKEN